MPTVAEPLWQGKAERQCQIVHEFVEAKPGGIDDSEDVFRARLLGAGLRGQDLDTEVRLAKIARFERRRCPATGDQCPIGGGCPRCQ